MRPCTTTQKKISTALHTFKLDKLAQLVVDTPSLCNTAVSDSQFTKSGPFVVQKRQKCCPNSVFKVQSKQKTVFKG